MPKELTTEQINEIALRNLTRELKLIRHPPIRTFVTEAIKVAPGRYWIRPSGNHPGHHPDDEHGDWGNLIHVKRVIIIAEILAGSEDLIPRCKDPLYAGLIIHDLGKYGIDGTDESISRNHPLLVHVVVRRIDQCPSFPLILGVAEAHMGRWGIHKPTCREEEVGHLADYIASRCTIHIPVELDV